MRPTKHRRRFHTDRIVKNRRARWMREMGYDRGHRLSYGALADRDPWDCGNPQCGVCHWDDGSRRARENREWQKREAVR